MRDYYAILGVTLYADADTIREAYQRKAAELAKIDVYDIKKMVSVETRWEFTLGLLEECRTMPTSETEWGELFDTLIESPPGLELVCDEVKTKCSEFDTKNITLAQVDGMRTAMLEVHRKIEQYTVQLKKFEEAYSTLINKCKAESHRNKLFVMAALKETAADQLPNDILDMIVSYASP
jgi:hypothetical protein